MNSIIILISIDKEIIIFFVANLTYKDNAAGNKKCLLFSNSIPDCKYCLNNTYCLQCKTLFLNT